LKLRLIAILALFGASFVPAWGSNGEQQLETFLTELKTLQARFSQLVESGEESQAYQSSGTFYLQRPGQFRWDYQVPEGQTIIADGNRIWVHDKELDQVSHKSQESALRGTPALLLTDDQPLDTHFKIRDAGQKDSLSWVELVPRDKESEFISVRLAFSGNLLQKMEMSDNFGQITRFEFTDMKRNQDLDSALFKFRPPPGIDILGD